MMKIISHRGYSSQRPENTISSFDYSLEKGFPYIELDIHSTLDGILVVMHDETVDRTTNGIGEIKNLTFSEIENLDAGSWFDEKFSFERVPTLEEILKRYAAKAHLFIEIKSEETNLMKSLRSLLIRYECLPLSQESYSEANLALPGVTVISFVQDQIIRANEILPEVELGFLLMEPDDSTINFCLDNEVKGYFPYYGSLTEDIVSLAHSNGLYVGAWGMETPDDLGKLLNLGIDGVTVNWPESARKVLEKDRPS